MVFLRRGHERDSKAEGGLSPPQFNVCLYHITLSRFSLMSTDDRIFKNVPNSLYQNGQYELCFDEIKSLFHGMFTTFSKIPQQTSFLSQFKHDPISIEFYVTQCKKCHAKYVASSTTLQLLSLSSLHSESWIQFTNPVKA